MIKLRRAKRVWQLACMKNMRNAFRIVIGKPEGRRPRLGWVTLKWFLKKWVMRVWTDFIWLRIGTM
jgi:hypothetical protein